MANLKSSRFRFSLLISIVFSFSVIGLQNCSTMKLDWAIPLSENNLSDSAQDYFERNNLKLIGDYVIPKSSANDQGLQVNKATGVKYFQSELWPNGEVIVKFDPKVTSPSRSNFMKACREWAEGSKVFCREANGNDPRPLYVQAEEGIGCWTTIGYVADLRREFKFNMDQNCWSDYSLVLHELGHVLGLIHEHQRPDRDLYVNVNLENVLPGLEYAFEKGSTQDLILGPYDVDSIMHYPAFSFSKNGRAVLSAKPGVMPVSTTNPQKLSAQDKTAIRELYGSNEAIATLLNVISILLSE